MMNRVEMNNEMLEQVNGGERIFDFAATSEIASRADVVADFATRRFQAMDFASAERLDLTADFAYAGR